ncbi:hypothetical protein RIF29_42459 [Crotalaria pallida]|uniref:Uncharacterized protein n=1 Tax=Crotalaria pallida TaxID=3830 RepID=A0AAN9HSE3_CROPI
MALGNCSRMPLTMMNFLGFKKHELTTFIFEIFCKALVTNSITRMNWDVILNSNLLSSRNYSLILNQTSLID